MEKYDVVHKLCDKLEKALEQETEKTFLLVPFIEGLTVGFVLAKDCSIIYRISFNLNGNIERAFDSASRQAEAAVLRFLNGSIAA